MTTVTDEVPDTERCDTWHANRYLTGHGLKPEDACTCCDNDEESA